MKHVVVMLVTLCNVWCTQAA